MKGMVEISGSVPDSDSLLTIESGLRGKLGIFKGAARGSGNLGFVHGAT